MQINSIVISVVLWLGCGKVVLVFALPRTKEVVSTKNGIGPEPTCEELKAMWRFSKRQSRAAEITNEIPMYRDPFSENVWEPYYATSRSMGGMRMGRHRPRPVYGRLVHNAPVLRIQDVAGKNRAFEELAQMYGAVQPPPEPRRRVTAFRLSGGGHLPHLGFPPQSGSFQHLKELIRTERARELQEQRRAEEIAAREAALKELASVVPHRNQANYRDYSYTYDFDDSDTFGRNRDKEELRDSSYTGRGRQGTGTREGTREGVIAFPDLLAPASRPEPEETRFLQDYSYSREKPTSHSSSMFDTSSYNPDYSFLV